MGGDDRVVSGHHMEIADLRSGGHPTEGWPLLLFVVCYHVIHICSSYHRGKQLYRIQDYCILSVEYSVNLMAPFPFLCTSVLYKKHTCWIVFTYRQWRCTVPLASCPWNKEGKINYNKIQVKKKWNITVSVVILCLHVFNASLSFFNSLTYFFYRVFH